MANEPTIEVILDGLVAGIKAADPEAGDRVYRSKRNVPEMENFAEQFMGDNQDSVHAWTINYLGVTEGREDDAGSLFYKRHAFELEGWLGMFNNLDETAIEAALIANKVAAVIEGLPSIFPRPEITERAVLSIAMGEEQLHVGLAHKATLSVEITATQFRDDV